MKISLAWVFDHIDADWKKVDVDYLVSQFNTKTAEIEDFRKISIDLSSFSLGQVKEIHPDALTVESAEWKKSYKLPFRPDAQEGNYYVIKKDGAEIRWAEGQDWQSEKECLIPAVWCDEKLAAGGWKKHVETEDYIFEVDNKSITHRPDMWCHRGFAREIAALLDQPFKPLDELLQHKEIAQFDGMVAQATQKHPFTIEVKGKDGCSRFAGLYIEDVEHKPSLLWMAARLLRVDSKPIDAIVDTTNYVMLDLSQPMHAFDADKIPTKIIMPRFAAKKEKLMLLDGQDIELTSEDFVISDGKRPIALAGIMGGLETAITPQTKSIFLESACFYASTVRRSAVRHKIRTEASMRFEKSLDPNQNTLAIMRFLRLLDEAGVVIKPADEIASVGAPAQSIVVDITHDFIEKRIGTTVTSDFIIETLQRLGFEVKHDKGAYTITVPTFRATKDIEIKEDIVEEVCRFFGYTAIPFILPNREMKPFSIKSVVRLRAIKEFMAYALQMREVWNYAFFDESFLKKLEWEPSDALMVQNPVSENWQRLAASLIPGLLKNVDDNAADYDQLRFFEWGRCWQGKPEQETQRLAGIFFNKKEQVDFYDAKQELIGLFKMLNMSVSWEQIDQPDTPWFAPYQTAHIICNGEHIGTAGKINSLLLHGLTEGDAFIFELNGDFLLKFKSELIRFKAPSKFPSIERDISIMIPLKKTVDHLKTIIAQTDPSITAVELIDTFEKPEWEDKKALTFRFVLQASDRTLSGQEADNVVSAITKRLEKEGAHIR